MLVLFEIIKYLKPNLRVLIADVYLQKKKKAPKILSYLALPTVFVFSSLVPETTKVQTMCSQAVGKGETERFRTKDIVL